jgi:hypothetical protein
MATLADLLPNGDKGGYGTTQQVAAASPNWGSSNGLPQGWGQMSTADQIHYLITNPSMMDAASQSSGLDPNQYRNWFNTQSDNSHTNNGMYNPDTGQYASWFMNSGNATVPTTPSQLTSTNNQPSMQVAPQAPPTTIGNIASGTPVQPQLSTGDSINMPQAQPQAPGVQENPANYSAGMDMSQYLNPQADYMQQQGLKNIQSTYAGAGNLLSGPAMKGISDYSQNMAQANAWQPAFNNYMADKNFNYGVDSGQQAFNYNAQNNDRNFNYAAQNNDRNFNYNAALNDQTIPFNQQSQLAGMGLQGASIGANQNNTLAQLYSGNLLGGANASAAGQIGGSNALINALQQALGQYSNNNLLSRLFPTTPGG